MILRRWIAFGLLQLGLVLSSAFAANAQEATPEQLQFFENRIRPVLVEQCYECHSQQAATEGKLRGGLSLDTRQATLVGGDSGPAVVPGKVDEGEMLGALRHETFEMPPSGKLSEEIIADFVTWIEMGAPDPRDGAPTVVKPMIDIAAGREHWAFRSLNRTPAPVSQQGLPSGWPDSPIDGWLDQAQRERGVIPNPTASARVLVRRLWFDLVGLPPTPEEMEEWVARLNSEGSGTSETSGGINFEAYSALVDHLLAHPGYGERWARHWMDLARFAESHGYEQDYNRPTAYPYRDFLIQAFNQDLPYDQFVQWQLAGDELAPNDSLAQMATGFLGGGAFPTQLTETEFESARYDELDDMVSTTGVAFLGLSVGCARCHDHKFDPVPSEDYYRLAATFASAIRSEVELDLDPKGNAAKREAFALREAELSERLQQIENDEVHAALREWIKNDSPLPNAGAWRVLSGSVTSSANTQYVIQPDASALATGNAPRGERLTFVAELPAGVEWRALRFETLADPSLPNHGPGRAANGNFALGDLKVRLVKELSAQNREVTEAKLIEARATHQQNDSSLSVAASIDDDGVSGWAIDGQIGKDQAAVFVPQEPIVVEPGTKLEIEMVFEHPNGAHVAGRIRWSVSIDQSAAAEVGSQGPTADVIAALERCRETQGADTEAFAKAMEWFRTSVPEWNQAQAELAALRAQGAGADLTKVLVTTEGLPHLPHHADDRGFPHFYPETYLLRRGDVHQKVEPVSPGFLQVLTADGCEVDDFAVTRPENARTSFRRAALAKWITDTDRGAGVLAARVMANRLWQHHFGQGLVTTVSDFGLSGAKPSQPELLDALAAELIDSGWSLKQLHRRMVTSAAYLRSSNSSAQGLAADLDNLTWWRRTPRRLEAEAIRDSMLAVSGQLDSTMYGPGTLDPNMRRRSVYFFIKRSELIPMMMLFDWPEHLVSIGQRSSTTIAPQALLFMNGVQGRQYAEALAGRLNGLEDSGAIDRLYQLAFGRMPEETERQLALEFLARQSQRHVEAGHYDPASLARVDLCQTVMSLNEFVYID
jgi:hypothetical protein